MKVKVAQSCPALGDSVDSTVLENPGEGSLSLLQGIFLTQGSNSGLLHCGQILYQLSYQGSLDGGMCVTDELGEPRTLPTYVRRCLNGDCH